MRIWQKVIGTTTCAVPAAAPPLLLYDNGFPTQLETKLGGGNIQIHLALNVLGGAVRAGGSSEALHGKGIESRRRSGD